MPMSTVRFFLRGYANCTGPLKIQLGLREPKRKYWRYSGGYEKAFELE
jgi:hypothetical protein